MAGAVAAQAALYAYSGLYNSRQSLPLAGPEIAPGSDVAV